MSTLGLASFGFSVAITTLVGIRLLLVAWRSRQLPELSIGLVMVMEVVSAGCWAVASATASGQLVSTLAAAVSAACLTLFIVYTFSPGSVLARIGAVGLLLLTAACIVLPTRDEAWGSGDFYVRFGWIASLARAIAYGWAAIVAQLSRDAHRRRARIGLSHPLTASRLGFWSLSSAFAAISFFMPILEILTDSVRPLGISPISIALAIGASSCVWLAFYPPGAYVKWAMQRQGRA